jgi:hypothetical protein
MIGEWKVGKFPQCSHHSFLSHCSEDRVSLVVPVFAELQSRKYSPWLDEHDYPRGSDPYGALREAIISSRHVIFFVTENFLRQGRGWTSVEVAYATLLQEHLKEGGTDLCRISFPLFFLPRGDITLLRSAWAPMIARGQFYPPGFVDAGAVPWAVNEIERFLLQEEIRGAKLGEQVSHDRSFDARLTAEPHLFERILCSHPVRV